MKIYPVDRFLAHVVAADRNSPKQKLTHASASPVPHAHLHNLQPSLMLGASKRL
jgi:hypothetical protein